VAGKINKRKDSLEFKSGCTLIAINQNLFRQEKSSGFFLPMLPIRSRWQRLVDDSSAKVGRIQIARENQKARKLSGSESGAPRLWLERAKYFGAVVSGNVSDVCQH
jgi:hypothetical protein